MENYAESHVMTQGGERGASDGIEGETDEEDDGRQRGACMPEASKVARR